MIGFLGGYGWLWYYLYRIADILSLVHMKNKSCITFDSAADNEFHVHLGNNRVQSFRESKKGLYYSDIREQEAGTVLVNTVEYNKTKYSSRDYLRALNARKLQNILCGMGYEHFRRIIRNNQLPNCPHDRRR